MTKMIEETKKGPRRTTAASGRTCAHIEDKNRCATILSVYNKLDRCSLHSGY